MADVRFIAVGAIGNSASMVVSTAAANVAFVNHTCDASNDGWACIFQSMEDCTITHVGFRYGVRAGTPPTYIASLQGVTTNTGRPDTTVKGGGSPASVTFTPPADTTWDGTWQWVQLANSYAASRGEYLAIVIAHSSGSVDGSNYSSFTSGMTGQGAVRTHLPYALTQSGGSWSTITASQPIFAYKSSSMVYGNPVQSVTDTLFGSTDTPDEYALCFQLPAAIGASFTVAGVRFLQRPAAGKTAKVQLYNGTTVLQTVTIDSDICGSAASYPFDWQVMFDETTLSTLSTATTYRIGIQAQEASGNWMLRTIDVAAANDLLAYPFGTAWYLSTRSDAGAWDADSTTKRPVIELILADITAPTAGGAGGLVTHAGMAGGMNG